VKALGKKKGYRVILVVHTSAAKTETCTDESGDYDTEFERQVWTNHLQEVVVSKNIRKEIENHNDGDCDYSSWVMFVLDAKTRRILIDYTESIHPNELNFMEEEAKKKYLDGVGMNRKDKDRKYESAIQAIEIKMDEYWKHLKEEYNCCEGEESDDI
jgi:hypothetical protein